MDSKNKKFDDTEIEKYKFHQYKSPISIDNIDVNKIVVSNKISFGKKNFKYKRLKICKKNILKFAKKSATFTKKNLTGNLYIIKTKIYKNI